MSLLPKCHNCGNVGTCNCSNFFPTDKITFSNTTPVWQLCPKCNGNVGVSFDILIPLTPYSNNYCKVCDNTGLINRLTGKPPKNNKMINIITPESDNGLIFPDINLFLAGTIDNGQSRNWQQEFINELMKVKTNNVISIFNPRRDNWNESATDADIKKQISWEDKHLSMSDLIIFNFLEDSLSPITLLELGERLALGHDIVVICNSSFWRYINVRQVVSKYGTNNRNVKLFADEESALKYIKNAIK